MLCFSLDGQYLNASLMEWDVRLTGSNSSCFGWLEIFHQDEWKSTYSQSWKEQNADVACKQLHCGPLWGTLNQTSAAPKKPEECMTIGCQGGEIALKDCRPHMSNCTRYLNVAILCQGSIPLLCFCPSIKQTFKSSKGALKAAFTAFNRNGLLPVLGKALKTPVYSLSVWLSLKMRKASKGR